MTTSREPWRLIIGDGGGDAGGGDAGGGAEQGPEPVWLSDDFLAQRLSDRVLRDGWLYVADWKQWLCWDGKKWRREPSLLVEDLARQLCRSEAEGVEDKRLARATDSAPAAHRATRLASGMKRHLAASERFDADPWLLNTPSCIVNLRTGQPQAHRRDRYMTRITAVAPGTVTGCPTWLRVLDEAAGGDKSTVHYLQRLFGYSVVGVVTEHVVAVLHGLTGGEGKSLIINTLAGVLGDYAAVAPQDMLTPQQGERHSTDLAGLAGARLVIASEIEDGRFWAEAKLKAISGGDKITARFMRADNFTYLPQFTLVIATNHLPQLRAAGGMRRRLQVTPFRHLPSVPDPELPEKLKAEGGGILTWAIEGAVRWQQLGLSPPPAVVEATDRYFLAENPITLWLDERCHRDRASEASGRELFKDFTSWAAKNGERSLSRRRFAQRLIEAGLTAEKVKAGTERGFVGVRLKGGSGELDL